MIEKRSVTIQGHRTSYSLEHAFHEELQAIAARRGIPLAQLIRTIDASRKPQTNLSSALRLYILHTLKQRLQEIEKKAD